MHLSDRETEARGSAPRWKPRSPRLPWAAFFADPGWASGPAPPALWIAPSHSSRRWPAAVTHRASLGSGAPGQVGERSPPSWPRQERTGRRSHLRWRPAGRRSSGPWKASLGPRASLSHSCCRSPGLTGTERPGHPATSPAGVDEAQRPEFLLQPLLSRSSPSPRWASVFSSVRQWARCTGQPWRPGFWPEG